MNRTLDKSLADVLTRYGFVMKHVPLGPETMGKVFRRVKRPDGSFYAVVWRGELGAPRKRQWRIAVFRSSQPNPGILHSSHYCREQYDLAESVDAFLSHYEPLEPQ